MALVDHSPLPRRRLLLLGTGTAVALVVWIVLVVTAVRLVGAARGGASGGGIGGWVLVVLVFAGAAASLFVGLLLGVRLVGVVRRREPAPAPHPKGGKRAAR